MPGNSTLYFELEMIDTAEGPEIDIFSEIDMDGDDKITEDELVYHSLAEVSNIYYNMQKTNHFYPFHIFLKNDMYIFLFQIHDWVSIFSGLPLQITFCFYISILYFLK